jgi:hypothetical protein
MHCRHDTWPKFLIEVLEPFLTLEEGAKLLGVSRHLHNFKGLFPASWPEILKSFPNTNFITCVTTHDDTQRLYFHRHGLRGKANLCITLGQREVNVFLNEIYHAQSDETLVKFDISDTFNRHKVKRHKIREGVETYVIGMFPRAAEKMLNSEQVPRHLKQKLRQDCRDFPILTFL